MVVVFFTHVDFEITRISLIFLYYVNDNSLCLFIMSKAGEVCEAEGILSRKKRNGVHFYLVKWKNFPTNDSSWEPETNILDKTLISEFEKRLVNCKQKGSAQKNPAKRPRQNSLQEGKVDACKEQVNGVFHGTAGTITKKRKLSLDENIKFLTASAQARENSALVNLEKKLCKNFREKECLPPDLLDLDTKYLDTFKQCDLSVPDNIVNIKTENDISNQTHISPQGIDLWTNKFPQQNSLSDFQFPHQQLGSEIKSLGTVTDSVVKDTDNFLPPDWESNLRSDTPSDLDFERFENLTASDLEAEEAKTADSPLTLSSRLKVKRNLTQQSRVKQKPLNLQKKSSEDSYRPNESVSDLDSDSSDNESVSSQESDYIIEGPDSDSDIETSDRYIPPIIYRGVIHKPIRLKKNVKSLNDLLDTGDELDPNDSNIIILQPEYILGIMKISNELIMIVKWKRINLFCAIPAEEMNLMYPEIVIEYYEQHLILENLR